MALPGYDPNLASGGEERPGSEPQRDYSKVSPVGEELPERRRDYSKPSLFRTSYRALTREEITLIQNVKAKAEELAQLYESIRMGRYRSLALTELEASVMWAVKEISA